MPKRVCELDQGGDIAVFERGCGREWSAVVVVFRVGVVGVELDVGVDVDMYVDMDVDVEVAVELCGSTFAQGVGLVLGLGRGLRCRCGQRFVLVLTHQTDPGAVAQSHCIPAQQLGELGAPPSAQCSTSR